MFKRVFGLALVFGMAAAAPPALAQNCALRGDVIAKLQQYQALGVDAFIYYASMGLDMAVQKRSLQLFIDEVMPAFAVGTELADAS